MLAGSLVLLSSFLVLPTDHLKSKVLKTELFKELEKGEGGGFKVLTEIRLWFDFKNRIVQTLWFDFKNGIVQRIGKKGGFKILTEVGLWFD